MDVDINILALLLKAEIDKENRTFDIDMRKLAWQTALLMTATGNYKQAVKPERLYTSPYEDIVSEGTTKVDSAEDVRIKREELKKTFGIE